MLIDCDGLREIRNWISGICGHLMTCHHRDLTLCSFYRCIRSGFFLFIDLYWCIAEWSIEANVLEKVFKGYFFLYCKFGRGINSNSIREVESAKARRKRFPFLSSLCPPWMDLTTFLSDGFITSLFQHYFLPSMNIITDLLSSLLNNSSLNKNS